MRHLIHLARLETLQTTRSLPARLGLGLGAVLTFAALVHGHRIIAKQHETLARTPTLQAEQHRAILDTQPTDAGAADQLYYLFFHTAHEPGAWAGFALGQRDLQPFNLKIRLLALQGQLHEVDLLSPLLAMYGHFDAAFVLVVLAPLLIIAFTYDHASAERENGTWDLARAQGVSPGKLIAFKLGLRTLIAALPLLLVVALAPVVLGAPLDGRFAAVLASTVLYFVLWALASAGVSRLGRGSDFNLLCLCGVWLAFTVVLPALLSAGVALAVPVTEAAELGVRQRHGYHSSWDRPIRQTMDDFYRRYPEWRGSAVPETTYSNAWYYAMQQRGDDEAEPAFRAYQRAVAERHALHRRIGAWIPPVALSQGLSAIARTDVDSHLAYIRSVEQFHESLKLHFHPAIFDNRRIGAVDWTSVPRHRFKDAHSNVAREAVPLLMWTLLLALGLRTGSLALRARSNGTPRSSPQVLNGRSRSTRSTSGRPVG